MQQTARYDVVRMLDDAALRGWLPIDLIRAAAPLSWTHGYRFLRGESQSPRVAEKLTRALGKRPGYYLLKRQAVA
jgi:hypothetical protein